MIRFRRKDFSLRSNMIQGATIGGSLGTMGAAFAPKKFRLKEYPGKPMGNTGALANPIDAARFEGRDLKNKYNNLNSNTKKLLFTGGGILVGAALGALVTGVEEIGNMISRTSINGKNLLSTVVSNLKKQSFKEGQHFTRDPKLSSELQMKVCIVVTRVSGDLKLIINTVSDTKLARLTKELTKNLPNSGAVTREASNRFNELTISTISDGSADAGLITGVAERFIRSGYPVYLVEVGM